MAEWLRIDLEYLGWFADLKGLVNEQGRTALNHYHYRILSKQFGSIRLIEAPKPRMKELQQRILSGILDRIPPHPAAHGFVQGRSILTFVAPHVNRPVVLKMDLRDSSPPSGLRASRVYFGPSAIRSR